MTDATPTAALDALLAEFETTSEWLADIDAERTKAHAHLTTLREAICALTRLLPAEDRAARMERLVEAALALVAANRPGPPTGRTDRMTAVHHFLATHPGDTVRTVELQRHLAANALIRDSRAAARALARKARQGMVEHLGHGRYRINPHHPELVEIRPALA